MPYSMSHPDKLPANVQKMSKQAQKQWVAVWNSAYSRCTKEGGDTKKCEGSAFAQANGVTSKRSKSKREGSFNSFLEGLDILLHRIIYGENSAGWLQQPTDRAIDMGQLYQGIQYAMADQWPSKDAVMPIDLYHEGSSMFLIYSEGHRLYRCEVMVDGADKVQLGIPVEVTRAFMATTPEGSQALIDKTVDMSESDTMPIEPLNEDPVYNQYRSLTVTRSAEGVPRWLMVAASSVLNRVKQIDSKQLFDSFVDNSEICGMPYLTFWHQEEPLRLGEADFIAREGALYLATGLFDDTPLGQAAASGIESHPEYWGASISYDPLAPPDMIEVSEGITVPVYTEGWNDEISILPESRAANWFTVSVTRGVYTMRQEVKDALVKLVGPVLADQFAGQVDNTNREIEDKKLITRSAPAATEASAGAAPVTTINPPAKPSDEAVNDMATRLTSPSSPAPIATPVTAPVTTQPPVERAAEVESPVTEVVLGDEFIDQMMAAFERSPILAALSTKLAELQVIVEPLQAAQLDVTRSLEEFDTRLGALDRTDEAKQREWNADRPAGRTLKVTYQPRVSKGNGIAPVRRGPVVTTDEDEPQGLPDLQSLASATLASFKAARRDAAQ